MGSLHPRGRYYSRLLRWQPKQQVTAVAFYAEFIFAERLVSANSSEALFFCELFDGHFVAGTFDDN